MTMPGLPPLFGAPWEQKGLYRLNGLIREAGEVLTAAHREAADIAASFPGGPAHVAERAEWVVYTNKIAHILDEMRRMLTDAPGT